MTQRILVVGGSGRIGLAVVRDLLRHTTAQVTIGGRNRSHGEAAAATLGSGDFLPVDLAHATVTELAQIARRFDLVAQCAGPFRTLSPTLLAAAIVAGVNYVDICDDRRATEHRLGLHQAAQAAGITALIDTGTFPGIDNVLVAAALTRLPAAESVRLSFVCAGSGDGGFGVLQTTFLAVSRSYRQLVDGVWRETPSYRQRELADFGPELGHRPVYNFEVPELWTLPHAFPQLRNCTSKFGTVPELWNWATWALARTPKRLRSDPSFLDRSAMFILPAVHRLDRLVGGALGIRIEVADRSGAVDVTHFYAPSTGEAVGWATGIVAAMVLDGTIRTPGVLLPETHIPPDRFCAQLISRGGTLRHQRVDGPANAGCGR